MASESDEDRRTYVVVVNGEEQYSIWLADQPIPNGWTDAGKRGAKAECLDHIEKVWTDMRPKSVRRAPEAPPKAEPTTRARQGKNELVGRLERDQPISLVGRPEPSRDELRAQLDRGRIFVRFDETGTELGVKLAGSALSTAKSEMEAAGRMKVEGELVLNYNRVTFVGEVDVKTFRGTGHLVYVADAEPS